ncbi:F0F1 ATP synthase subunit delta [Telmatospirillum sp. J64-1]|uniref:F0F1 ATP synthase subunit delta n=1 Tax=Telmatospirillum sp. J64-1 TaxID=2502183 RepID=UPI00115DFCA3|nr:F0F1 ATP synthase subunit delta [Telmatospirillum sp. J64-1]
MSSEPTGAIAERYAAALFELAETQGSLDQIAADLKALKAMLASSADLRRALTSPVISRADQEKAIAALAAKAGFQDLTQRFLGLVAKNRRLSALEGMIRAYLDRLSARRGEVVAQVASATELNESQRTALAASLKKVVGGNVSLDVSVDPALLGGMVVKVGSRMVDSSLRTKLQRLQLAMKGVG